MPDETRTGSPFNIWWVGAGILLIAVLAAAIFIGMGIGRGQDNQSDGEQPAADPSEQTKGNGTDGACNIAAGDQNYPQKAPATQWELYDQQMKVPTSKTLGPAQRSGKFWRCYAHSPAGAVFAGVGLTSDFSVGGVKEAAAPSSARDEYFADQNGPAGDEGFADVVGYKILDYSADAAKLSYMMQQGDAKGSLDVTLKWDEAASDWRMDLESEVPDGRQLSDSEADGYVKWATHG